MFDLVTLWLKHWIQRKAVVMKRNFLLLGLILLGSLMATPLIHAGEVTDLLGYRFFIQDNSLVIQDKSQMQLVLTLGDDPEMAGTINFTNKGQVTFFSPFSSASNQTVKLLQTKLKENGFSEKVKAFIFEQIETILTSQEKPKAVLQINNGKFYLYTQATEVVANAQGYISFNYGRVTPFPFQLAGCSVGTCSLTKNNDNFYILSQEGSAIHIVKASTGEAFVVMP
jgi:hypothetical protein